MFMQLIMRFCVNILTCLYVIIEITIFHSTNYFEKVIDIIIYLHILFIFIYSFLDIYVKVC